MIEIQKYNRIIVANWKLNGSTSFLSEYLRSLDLVKKPNNNSLTVICPPFPFSNQFSKEGLVDKKTKTHLNNIDKSIKQLIAKIKK